MARIDVNEGLGFIRFVLVWSSLSPVFLLWSIRGVAAVPDRIWIPVCLTLFVLPTAIIYLFFRRARKTDNVKTIEVDESHDQREHLLTYLFAMLIPLFDVNLGGIRDILAVAFALALVIFLFWYMRLHYMNLIFALWGYRIYTVEAKTGATDQKMRKSRPTTFAVISRRHHLLKDSTVTGYRLGGNVLVDKNND